MNFEKAIRSFYRICDAIRRFLRPSAPNVDNFIPNGSSQPDPQNRSEEKSENTENQATESEVNNNKPPKPPQNRGGVRGKSVKRKPTGHEQTPPEARAELICREMLSDQQWQILLVLPHGLDADVSQGKSRLLQSNNGEYPLSNFTKEINWEKNDESKTIKLFENEAPLIFKLGKNWKGEGRQVKRTSHGYYIVFAPNAWQRINSNPPVNLSRCSDQEFSAHYFFSDDNGNPDGFCGYDSFFSEKRFSLQGETVADDSNRGDLFVGDTLQFTDTKNWQGVSWVRVGEEGGGAWGEHFKPSDTHLRTVLEKREGWFYVRVYDNDGDMIDGFAFRRLLSLEKILIAGETYVPASIIAPDTTGHHPQSIQFVGKIQVESDNSQRIAVSDNNTVVIDPKPDIDRTQWKLIGDNGHAQVDIQLKRIWWRLDNAGWKDVAFQMSREEFYRNRNAEIVVRLPTTAKSIDVGFDSFNEYDGVRSYQATNYGAGIKHAKFQLRDFSDHAEIENPSSKEADLRIRCDNTVLSVVRISADVPKPKPDQKPPDKSPPDKTLRPATKNKRFSRAELDVVGPAPGEANHLKIAVDRRRKTKYEDNIDKLKEPQRKNHAD